MIVDTHLHIIDRSALRYPWLAGVPALDRDFSYEDYALQARRAGIGSVLHMEVDVDAADIDAETVYVSGLAAQSASLLAGAIAACRPEEEGFAAALDRACRDPFVKGFRRVLHVMPDELSESPVFRENLKRLSGTGLTFDLCVLPRQLPRAVGPCRPRARRPVRARPLRHSGHQGRCRAKLAGSDLTDIARRPNLVAKISGVVAYADPADWTVETLRPYVEHTIESFGWDRVVWGSDWPVCTLGGGLATWVAATHALTAGASAEERGKLLSGNARRLWRL